MNKEKVYVNIFEMINNGLFFEKYVELTCDISLDGLFGEAYEQTIDRLEDISAKIFNAILIGCQLFDDRERIIKFVNMFSSYLNSDCLMIFLPNFGITEEEALERLKHGFGVHFTTVRICNEIQKKGCLFGYGKNAMFTEYEDLIIENASKEQRANDPSAAEKMNYLFKGWGTGVSSYSSMTKRFWMYHTPESLSFLFGNISRRNKTEAMMCVSEKISALSEENKKTVFNTMSNIYDRLVGEEQEVGCVLIDRDAFEYEVDYYYNTGKPVAVERRPYSNDFNSLMSSDNKISNDIDVRYLRFLSIPTVLELERKKQEKIQNVKSTYR